MLSEAAFKLLCFSFAVFDLQMFYSQAHEVDHGQGLHLIKKKNKMEQNKPGKQYKSSHN